jgi:hypothetical protein
LRKHRGELHRGRLSFYDPLARIFDDPAPRRGKVRQSEKSMTTKNTLRMKPKKGLDSPRAEYRFDYAKSKPNRFAGRIRKGSVAVLLDPDVAQLFKSADSVNAVLRALMSTMPVRRAATR